jgi:SET domain-containing protein
VCPFIEIPDPDSTSLETDFLINYYYFFGEKKERVLIALGFGSLYNHNYAPNATYTIKPEEQLIIFTALKNIKKDEEIVVNYNQGNGRCAPLWFEV